MHYRTWVFALLIGAASFGGFKAGVYYDARTRQPIEIMNGCAYYDMDTGAFTWGQRPVTIGMLPQDLAPALGNAVKQLQKGVQRALGNQ